MVKISAGDESAYAEFYDRHAGRTYGFLMHMLKNTNEAEDILQDVFWQAWSKAKQYDSSRGTPIAWLILIARSRALDGLRRRKRIPSPVEEVPDQVSHEDASISAIASENSERAQHAMENLPIEQKKAIQLAFFDGLSHSEIAEREKLPLGTVKTRVRSGLNKLRDTLVAGEKGSHG